MLYGQGEYWIAAATIWYANGRHAVDTPGYRHQVRSASEDILTLTLTLTLARGRGFSNFGVAFGGVASEARSKCPETRYTRL